jgi:hypothetical protein
MTTSTSRCGTTTRRGSSISSRAAAGSTPPNRTRTAALGYERDHVRLELTYNRRRDDGRIVIPLRGGDAELPDGTFGEDTRTLEGVSARLVALATLREGKSAPREASDDAAKDVADSHVLSGL